MKDPITLSDFAKLDLRVGEILEANEVEQSDKLIELIVDLGSEIGKKTIYAGVKKWYSPESLKGRKLVFAVNLEPKKFKIGGKELVSDGMMVAALRQAQGEPDEAVLYAFDKGLPSGTIIR